MKPEDRFEGLERDVRLKDGRCVRIRPIRRDDAERMGEFFESIPEEDAFFFYPCHLDRENGIVIAQRAEEDGSLHHVAVAVSDGRERIVGHVFIAWSDRNGVPGLGLCVRRGYQSSGLGGHLMAICCWAADQMGWAKIRLTAHVNNPRAVHLYEKNGFRRINTFMNSKQDAPQYCMERSRRGTSG